jgi:hypothetical protein
MENFTTSADLGSGADEVGLGRRGTTGWRGSLRRGRAAGFLATIPGLWPNPSLSSQRGQQSVADERGRDRSDRCASSRPCRCSTELRGHVLKFCLSPTLFVCAKLVGRNDY